MLSSCICYFIYIQGLSQKTKTLCSLKILSFSPSHMWKILYWLLVWVIRYCVLPSILQYKIIENFLFFYEQNRKYFWFSIKWAISLRVAYPLTWKSGMQFPNGSPCGLSVTGHICLGKYALSPEAEWLDKSVSHLALEDTDVLPS